MRLKAWFGDDVLLCPNNRVGIHCIDAERPRLPTSVSRLQKVRTETKKLSGIPDTTFPKLSGLFRVLGAYRVRQWDMRESNKDFVDAPRHSHCAKLLAECKNNADTDTVKIIRRLVRKLTNLDARNFQVARNFIATTVINKYAPESEFLASVFTVCKMAPAPVDRTCDSVYG